MFVKSEILTLIKAAQYGPIHGVVVKLSVVYFKSSKRDLKKKCIKNALES